MIVKIFRGKVQKNVGTYKFLNIYFSVMFQIICF